MRGTNILVRKRLACVFLTGLFIFLALMTRVAWIQFVKGDELKSRAEEVRLRDIPVEARRGSIIDRNGNELVTSVSVDSIFAIPGQVENPRLAAEKLSEILDMEEKKLYEKITQKTAFVWLKRKVDLEISKKVKELNLEGIKTVEESKRYYLHDTLAPHVLGFTGIDNQGLLGLEKSFDEELRGIPGRIMDEHDAMGRPIPEAIHDYTKPVPGNNLVTTLDKTIQYFVERELDNVVSTYDPKLAVAIVMDPRTGEILAMGNRPSFNPNHWQDAPKDTWDRNPAIWYNYEPGSTFKIVTASTALELEAVNAEDRFFDPGYISVADRRIRCWKAGGHGSQSFREVVQNSCNPGFVEVGLRIGKDNFYDYIKAFGLDKITGINLPGEAKGIMIPEKDATNLNIAAMSIGQSIAVTPIQLIMAISAAANGGELVKPKLLKEVTDPGGKTVKKFAPEVVRKVISEETSKELRGLLEQVVAKGTGKNAFIEGYRVAGKTGTAQVVGDRGYVQGKYVSSFAGFAPADDPSIAILVMIAEPKGGVYYGGQVAAPVFQAIAKDVLRYLKVPRIEGQVKPKKPWESEEVVEKTGVPNVINLPVGEAQQLLKNYGLNFELSGEGDIVYAQVPHEGVRVDRGSTVLLKCSPASVTGDGKKITVPDLSGLTIKEAASILEDMGLYLNPQGSGIAAVQSIKPGSKTVKGKCITVQFHTPIND